jgi:hypothetical protein
VAKKDSAAPGPAASAGATLSAGAFQPPLDQVARDMRMIAASRADLGKQLAAREVGRAADADPEVAAQLAQAVAALSGADNAAAAWQRDLSAAAAWWEACLADLAKRHPEAAAD